MVASCGNRCCAPGCSATGPLQQGHIEAHDNGGYDNPQNLIPVCQSCNNKFKKLSTPDGRPYGWRERFFACLAYELRPRFIALPQNGSRYAIPANETIDSTEVIVWRKPDFGPVDSLFTRPLEARKTALGMVEEIKRESQNQYPTPHLPNEARNRQLVIRAEGDPQGFPMACREFLRRQGFVRDANHVLDDSWGPLCANYPTYRRWAAEYRAETARARAAADREARAGKFRAILNVPADWDRLTDEEKSWRADAETRELAAADASHEDCKRNSDVYMRYQGTELERRAAETRLKDSKDRLHNRMKLIPEHFREAFINEHDNLWYAVRGATNLDEIKCLADEVEKFIFDYKDWNGRTCER
jgi:hypothetical protein